MDIEQLITYSFQDSLFPELIEWAGFEKSIEFIKIFGGTTLVVPSVESIQNLMRDFDVHQRLSDATKDDTVFENTTKRLAIQYCISTQEVLEIYNTMKQLADLELATKIRGWKSRRTKPRGRTPEPRNDL